MTTPPPTGHVTLVFTDVEGSTALWEAVPDAMREGLQVHDDRMREGIAAHRGYEVKTEGDAFMVSFADPEDALAWCLWAQEALLDAPWPEALVARAEAAEVHEAGQLVCRGLRVRMGIHCGEPDCRPDPVTGRMDYFGPMVNRAARVGGAAHGGQVLLSGSAHAGCTSSATLADAVTQDLGEHGLKGLATPERLVEVTTPRLAARRFPPVRTLDVRRTNLPDDDGALFGRARECAELTALLGDEARLVTLLGPGGMGKTRLSREVGRQVGARPRFQRAGGIWFCDLTAATTAAEVAAQLGEVLGVNLARGDATTQLGQALAGRGPLLLILDNLEQVVQDAAGLVRASLENAPELVVLATSRAPLEIEAEQVYELHPLDVEAGVELFAARAAAARRGWTLDPEARPEVDALVRRLDAMPLALELAAARVRVFSVAKLRARLDERLDVLKARGRDPRQATLRGAIDWSWRLLEPEVQRGAAACAVFRGGFDLEAAEEVLGEDAPEIVDELLRHSFLRSVEERGDLRYHLYEAIRQYLDEHLDASGERAAIEGRHIHHYADRADAWADAARRPATAADALANLRAEQENLLAAAQRAAELDPRSGARLVLALDTLLMLRGPAALHRKLFQESYRLRDRVPDAALRARICLCHARLCSIEGDPQQAREALDAGRAEAGAAGFPELEFEARRIAGIQACFQGEFRRATTIFAEALADAEASGDVHLQAKAHWHLAFAANGDNRADEHLDHALRCRDLAVQHGLRIYELHLNLGEAYLTAGRLDEAEAALRTAADEAEQVGDEQQRTSVLRLMGVLELERGSPPAARACLNQAIRTSRQMGTHAHTGFLLRLLGLVDVLEDRPADAVEHLREGQRLVETMAFWALMVPLRAYEAVAHHMLGDAAEAARCLDEARATLGEHRGAWQAQLLEVLGAALDGRDPPPAPPEETSYNLRHARTVAAKLAARPEA